MERVKDSIQTSCSSPFNSSSTGLPFKRRPTCQTNEENGQPDLFKDTVMLPDRAARKEMERQRLRKLLNQGKKKRRRLNGDKLIISPTPLSYCHSREPELKPSGLSPAMPICGHIPRKSRSAGNRRRGKSWRSIGLDLQVQLPIASAPTVVEKSSPSPAQDEIEIEFEIAEVLYGLKKQVSSSDEPLIDDLEKIPVEIEENQSISVQGCSVDKASSYYTVNMSKAESISTGPKLGTHNHDKAVIKQEASKAEERSLLCSNLASNSVNLTTEGISAIMEETERKQPEKFVIDLNEPPPMESSLEGEGLERFTSSPKVVFKEEVKLVTEEATIKRSVKKEMVYEMQLPRKMEIKDEIRNLDLGSLDDTKNESKQQFQKQQKAYSVPLHHIHMPLRPGHKMSGPLIFPLNQNQTLTTNQPGLSVSPSSTENVRFRYPIGAPFVSVSPGNICTSPSSNGKRMHSSGGKIAQPVPFLDGRLHPSQILLPIQIQQQKQLPFTTQTTSSVADSRTSGGQRNVTWQSLFPLHSPNEVSMPSAASSGGGQWRYAEQYELKSDESRCSTPSFSFASSTQSSSMDAAGLGLNYSLPPNPAVAPDYSDKPKLGSQIPPADHRLQYRNSEMIQKINQADSTLTGGNSPAFLGHSGFILKSCSSVSSASVGAKVFDNSVTTPNCKLAFAKQNALSARIHLSNSNPLGASRDKPTSVRLQNQQQQMSQIMAASQLKVVPTVNNQHQPAIAAKLSTDFSIFTGNLFDKPSHSLRQ